MTSCDLLWPKYDYVSKHVYECILFIRLYISKIRFSMIVPTLTKMALHLFMIFVAVNESDKNPRYLHHLSLSFSSGSDTRFISLLWGHQLGRRKSSSKYNFDTMNITQWRQNHIGVCCYFICLVNCRTICSNKSWIFSNINVISSTIIRRSQIIWKPCHEMVYVN